MDTLAEQFFYLSASERRGVLSMSCDLGRDLDPVPVRWADGSRPQEIMDARRWLVLSPRALDTFESLGLSGWEPREIAPDDSLRPFDLKGHVALVVHGRSAAPRFRRSDLVDGRGPAAYAGFAVDDWDGSDIFHPDGTGFHLLSERAHHQLAKARLTGMVLEPLSSIETFANEVEECDVRDD